MTWVLAREIARNLLGPFRFALQIATNERHRARSLEVLRDRDRSMGSFADPEVTLAGFLVQGRAIVDRQPHVFLSAGETSGEMHAAQLMDACKEQGLDARYTAFGGDLLKERGADVRFPLSSRAIMGLFGVFAAVPWILRAYYRWLKVLRDDPPDLVVLMDNPGLHVVMALEARRHKIPVVHYVAPQYWAWGPWRMQRYRHAVDACLTILPFETAFFRAAKVPAHYIGHPLLDELERERPDPKAVAAVRAERTLVILPGSRSKEIRVNLPGQLRVVQELREAEPELRAVVVHRDPKREALIREVMTGAQAPDGAPKDRALNHGVEVAIGPIGQWLAGAHLVLAKSGTGSLEASLHGTPTLVVYQTDGAFSQWIFRNSVTVPFIGAANLIAGREIVPEFIFADPARWGDVAKAARKLWQPGEDRAVCLENLSHMRRELGRGGASGKAAAILARFFRVPAQQLLNVHPR